VRRSCLDQSEARDRGPCSTTPGALVTSPFDPLPPDMIPPVAEARWYQSGSTTRDVGLLGSSRIVSVAVQGATYIVAARSVSPASFGVVLAALAIASASLALLDLGLSSYSMRELAGGRLDARQLRTIIEVRATAVVIGVAVWLIAASVFEQRAVVVAAYLASESLFGYVSALAVAGGRITGVAVVTVAARASTLVGVVLGLSLPSSLAIGSAIGVVLLRIDLSQLPSAPPETPTLGPRVTLRRARPFFASSLLAQASNLDTTLVAATAGSAAASFYGLPSRLTTPLGTLAHSFAQVVLRKAARAHADDDRVALGEIRRSIVRFGLVSAVVLGVGALVAGPVIPAVLGHSYTAAVTPLRVIVVAVAINALNNPLSSLLDGAGRARDTARVLAIAVPLGLLGVAIGAQLGGAATAGWGLVLMQTIALVLFWRISSEEIHVRVTES
jgi:O-antigen/teichoic acid export membrane protein